MTKAATSILLSALIYFLIGCDAKTHENKNSEQENNWELEKRVTKKVDNFNFIFPSEGYAYDNRDLLVQTCIDALKENCSIIKIPDYQNPIKIIFLNNREEMEEEVGMPASGWTNVWNQKIHIVANDKFTPPIKHEILHLISMTTWGYPHDDLIWINEGLATTTEKYCNSFTVGEIYRYFIENEMLISIDSLTNDFYGQASIVSYHQSAHIVQYMINNYGLEKFEELWKKGFSYFKEIYSISFSQMEEEINKMTLEEYPTPVSIDWDVFEEGCF